MKKIDSNIIAAVLQIIVLLMLFGGERYYDRVNIRKSQLAEIQLTMLELNGGLISICSSDYSPSDNEFKQNVKRFKDLYNGVSFLFENNKIKELHADAEKAILNITKYNAKNGCENLTNILVDLNIEIAKDFY